jgi:hypothetical protein
MRKPDPVEIAAITIPVLCEVVAVTLFIAACLVGLIVLATPVPA